MDSPDLTPDPSPGALAADADADLTPDLGESVEVVVFGLLGESHDPDRVRLFLDLDFETYYDIPRGAIVDRERLAATDSPLRVDASRVLIRAGTRLRAHRSEEREVETEFLSGDFTAPASFQAYSARPISTLSPVGGEYTWSRWNAPCCNPQSEGCTSFAMAADSETWPTKDGNAGCTRNANFCPDFASRP